MTSRDPCLEDQARLRRRKLVELDAAISRGVADADAGRARTIEEVRDYLHARYQKMADDRAVE